MNINWKVEIVVKIIRFLLSKANKERFIHIQSPLTLLEKGVPASIVSKVALTKKA